MILVQIPAGVAPCHIEFPEFQMNERGRPVMEEVEDKKGKKSKQPKEFGERSCKGSLRLAPGTKIISAPELAYVKKHFPETRLHVLQDNVKSPKQAAEDIAAKLKAMKPADKTAEAAPGPAPSAATTGSKPAKPKK